MNKTVVKSNRNTYLIRLGINAQCEAEEILGFPLSKLAEYGMGVSTLRILMYVGLRCDKKNITLEEAGEIVEEVMIDKGAEYLGNQISKALSDSLVQQKSQNFKQQHNSSNSKKNR